ncbi:MAG TPA: DUF72 domain-containing protein [Thermoanaerobaculia bacterium]|nr:DUF72 domain-containing protein [Thermoanaerobaculia bacterium]
MSEIRFGTASFAYEGWKGIVYHERYREATFKVDCLREYARFAPFRTVEFDFPFYRPPTAAQLTRYAAALPAGFPVVSKVWEELTMPRFPELPRHGPRAGAENPRYLDARAFREEVLPAYEEAFSGNAGPFVFEFPTEWQPSPARRAEFLGRLESFLGELPPRHTYAVEIRTPAYFAPDYFDVLRRRGAAHVFNWWTRTPPLLEQWEAAQPLPRSLAVVRILVPPGMAYEDAVARFQPYDRILAPREDMRGDLVRLVRHIAEAGADAFVLVNNRAEGCAPLTIRALARELGIPIPPDPKRSLFD